MQDIKRENTENQNDHTLVIEGRNAVLEAFRSGRTIDKLFVLDGCQDGPVRTIVREGKKHGSLLSFVSRERLNQLSQTGKHQGVIAYAAAYDYSEIDDMLKLAEERGEDPFLLLLDGIEDPHNLGAIVPESAPVPTASSFQNAVLSGSQLQLQRHLRERSITHRLQKLQIWSRRSKNSRKRVCGLSVRIWTARLCMT